ncbi:MAG: cyclase family protein [Rhodospirillales bacterium]
MTGIPEELRVWPGHVGNWHRWPNDRGALNLITPEATRRGLAMVRSGRTIQLARPLGLVDPPTGKQSATWEMDYLKTLDPEGLCQSAGDRVSYRTHGLVNTHIDAFSHVGYRGWCFNGHRFTDVIDGRTGAGRLDVTDVMGIVTRAVFVDVARARGVPGLAPGEWVRPDEIAPAVARMRPGDAIVIRTGVTVTGGHAPGVDAQGRPEHHGRIAGLHADCVDLIGRADGAVIASDSGNDTYPSPVPECASPVHRLAEVFWGIPLVHNMDLEDLGRICAEEGLDDFLFVVSALNIPRATGALCTPLAIL